MRKTHAESGAPWGMKPSIFGGQVLGLFDVAVEPLVQIPVDARRVARVQLVEGVRLVLPDAADEVLGIGDRRGGTIGSHLNWVPRNLRVERVTG
jgi:hypothetical protein